MAEIVTNTDISIKNTTVATAVPDAPIARLMYYIDCVCLCLETEKDATFHRLRDYKNHARLSNEEDTKLLALCLALSPDRLIGTIFFPAEDLESEFSNDFFELSTVSTKLVVAQSLLIGGQHKKVCKVMMFKQCWIDKNYNDPLRAVEKSPIHNPPSSSLAQQRSDDCVIL